jgi:flagellar motor switch protein FliN/FliY
MADELSQSEIDALLSQGLSGVSSPAESIKENSMQGGSKTIKSPSINSGPINKDIESLLMDVSLNMKIEIGRTKLSIDQVLRLREGSVVELDKVAGDPVDILVNNRLVAKGEILVLNEAFCIRITEIVSPKERLARGL